MEEVKVVSYAFENEIVEVFILAVASRTFDIPGRFSLKLEQVNLDLDRGISIDIEINWKEPDKCDVNIEREVCYGGRWRFSKFRVVRS